MIASILLLLAQTPVFKENAKIGVPMKVGYDARQGGKSRDWGTWVNIAVNSVHVETSYPCVRRVILAESGRKLLIFNVSITNPSKIGLVLNGDSMPWVGGWSPAWTAGGC